jgi:lysophospholipase L1-like esterase
LNTFLRLDGIDDFLTTASKLQYDEIKLDFRPYPTSVDSYYISGKTDAFGAGGSFWHKSTNIDQYDIFSQLYKNGAIAPNLNVITTSGERIMIRGTESTARTEKITLGARYSTGSVFAKMDVYKLWIYKAGVVVAYFDFTTGTLKDQSVNNNQLVLTGGTWVKNPNYYLAMDGVSNYIKAPTLGVKEVVIDFVAEQNAGANQYYFDSRTGLGSYVQRTNTNVDTFVNGTLKINNVSYPYATYNNTAFVPTSKRITLDFTLSTSTGTDDITFFADNTGASNLKGRVYSIKLYDYSLNLIAYYDLTKGIQRTGQLHDETGNGNHATLYGGTWLEYYDRGYKLFEPKDPSTKDVANDNVVKIFYEGVDYFSSDLSVIFNELTSNSAYLTGGDTEYRYFQAFDDENTGITSNIFSILNLMPPTNVSVTALGTDTVQVTFTNAQYASNYKYALRNMVTDIEVYGTLSSDGKITGLNQNTTYELRLSSANTKGESTEWSGASRATTVQVFELIATGGTRTISWSWEIDTATIRRFELVDVTRNTIMYSGLSKTYFLPETPVQKYTVYVRAVFNDGTEKLTPNNIASVHDDNKKNFSYTQNVLTNDKSTGTFNLKVSRDTKDITQGRQEFYKENISNLKTFLSTYSTGTLNNPLNFGVFNNLVNVATRVYQSAYQNGAISSAFGEKVSRDSTQRLSYNLTVINAFANIMPHKHRFLTDFKKQIDSKLWITTDYKSNLTFKNTIIKDGALIIRPQFFISVDRTTQYGLKWGLFNAMTSNVARGRQITYNPINPFGVDEKDIIYNGTIANIDIKSQVNKVRIMCIGDSITAGAPLYDPNYGGTVYMSDLITGKTVTRNVKESSYPYWLQVRLGIDDFEVINEGSGRRTSTEVLFNIDSQMKNYKPDYVIVMIGTNDMFSAQDTGANNLANQVNTTLSNIRRTIDTIVEYGGIPILGTQLPRNSIVPIEAKNALRNLNVGIKNLGIEYMTDVIDWYNVFVVKDQSGVETGVLRYDLSGDDTHPTISGYKTMAYAINLGIFNSFRASLRVFGGMKGNDVDYALEETKVQPDPYTLKYTISFPELRRLQRYVFSKYIKNTGNSWGLFVIQLSDLENVCEIWDAKTQTWVNYLVGSLAPNAILELRMRYILPATGTTKTVDFNIDYIVKR